VVAAARDEDEDGDAGERVRASHESLRAPFSNA
jgi:hypothetical protein